MTKQNEAKKYAESIGAVVTKPQYYEHDQSYVVEAEAPDGKQWRESGSLCLVEIWWTYIKGSKDEAYQDLIDRMKCGLEQLDEDLNPQ